MPLGAPLILFAPLAFYMALCWLIRRIDRATHEEPLPPFPLPSSVLLAVGLWTILWIIVLSVLESTLGGFERVKESSLGSFALVQRLLAVVGLLGAPFVTAFLAIFTVAGSAAKKRGGSWFLSILIYLAAWLTLASSGWMPTV